MIKILIGIMFFYYIYKSNLLIIVKGAEMRINLIVALVIAVLFFACKDEVKQSDDVKTIGHKVEIEEVIQANVYTYLRVTEDDKEYWMAITKNMDVKDGETIYYMEGLEMTNFESRDLSRTFESIYFVQNISKEPFVDNSASMAEPQGQKPVLTKQDVKVEPIKGGVSIADLYSNRTSYGNKTIKVTGKVTKFNAGIMGRNWVHLQDGTSDGDNFDLTVTTNDDVKLGDVVVFEGTISLKKDFGAGYSYEVIMEDSKLIK